MILCLLASGPGWPGSNALEAQDRVASKRDRDGYVAHALPVGRAVALLSERGAAR